VYIYTNSRVLREKPRPDPVRWYDANIHSEDSDPDELGPVPVDEENREFDEMRAQEEEDDDMEANRAPREYPPNLDLWAEGADHLDEARNYYGEDDVVDEDLYDGRWGPWRTSPRRSPSPNRDDHETRLDNNENDDNPSFGNGDGNGDDHNNRGGGIVGNTTTPNGGRSVDDRDGNSRPRGVGASLSSPRLVQRHHGTHMGNVTMAEPAGRNQTVVNVSRRFDPNHVDPNDAFAFRDDLDHGPPSVAVRSVVVEQRTPSPRSLNPSSPATSNAINGFSQERVGGRPPIVPRPPLHHPMGQYQQGHGRIGGRGRSRGREGNEGRGGIGGRGVTTGRGGVGGNIARGGRNDGEASSSRPTTRSFTGIGVRNPNVVIEPFVDTYVPGRTSSTPAFVVSRVPSGTAGPTINSDAEDPSAHRHKKFKRSRNNGETIVELRNENSEVEGYWTSDGSDGDNEHDNSEGADDEDVPDCDEAPADDDVVIRDVNLAGPSTQEERRSSRLNN